MLTNPLGAQTVQPVQPAMAPALVVQQQYNNSYMERPVARRKWSAWVGVSGDTNRDLFLSVVPEWDSKT